ncbi:hypothetical protein P22_1830 [Propionispora sp. 2/2-37]|uniref:heavy-metal-associated domain-containing protein n=1 Tax=Propionispora sp. 2/2-37 TaxID=1677858 RepID=UPI0006BB8164|nr:cation transporter [Propionispora sp. 2/2-37]CUH95750.1 hypothetical protein P22_1830 [Propionispora sp. 2/2-37]
MEKIILTVKGMSCAHCKAVVERAVLALPGIIAAQVDLDTQKLSVAYDNEKITLAEITTAVGEEGYTVAERE